MHHDYSMNATTTLSQMSSSISLPPISAIHTTNGGHAAPHDLIHNVHPPTRTLPPPGALSYYPTQAIPQPPGYVIPGRPVYADVGTHYGMSMHRMPLPSDPPPNILVAVSRHTPKTKEVKRRTKTGCMTCRKRRIKVSLLSPSARLLPIPYTVHHVRGRQAWTRLCCTHR